MTSDLTGNRAGNIFTGARSELQEMVYKALESSDYIAIETTDLPGPTGESNRLSQVPRGVVLCLGADVTTLAQSASASGCPVVVLQGELGNDIDFLETIDGISAVCCRVPVDQLREIRVKLAARTGKIVPLVTEGNAQELFRLERHVCVDTTASGGNAALLAAQ